MGGAYLFFESNGRHHVVQEDDLFMHESDINAKNRVKTKNTNKANQAVRYVQKIDMEYDFAYDNQGTDNKNMPVCRGRISFQEFWIILMRENEFMKSL